MSKCDVCGKETSTMVYCSTCGAISFAYCQDCMFNGIEPYDALVGMGLFYADMNKTYRQQILDPSLKFHGKTREQFDADVEAQYGEEREWFETHDVSDVSDADDFEM